MANPITLYGPVNGQAKKVTKLYGPVDILTNCSLVITRDPSNMIAGFNAPTFISKMQSSHPEYLNKEFIQDKWLRIVYYKQGAYSHFQLFLYNGSSYTLLSNTTAGSEAYGLSFDSSSCTGSEIAYLSIDDKVYSEVAKEIQKLYGPVEQTRYTATWDQQYISTVNVDTFVLEFEQMQYGEIPTSAVVGKTLLGATDFYSFTVYGSVGGEVSTHVIAAGTLTDVAPVLTQWGIGVTMEMIASSTSIAATIQLSSSTGLVAKLIYQASGS